ncbi:baeRF3 domain-containing protein [Allorhodopirellula solitaria]|uniref:Uncharacterized protein n=1 Tax=Allorhodopirellula solitaria TaxID=2527987 RepID=A0A5C5YHM6_9BACT|nr:hypothetical protein [Allorhodopirellula solitaria]TWT73052.1 hypothetical protein CA85_15180 [Allorhodopirellula solitaria]
MIDHPTKQDLVDLIGSESGLCVSILMPTHEDGHKTTENPIRFKNLLKQAIEEVGDQCSQVRQSLVELEGLAQDHEFWQNQLAGFALFLSKDGQHRFRLSHSPAEHVCVAEHYYLPSIAAAACGGGTVRALALSWEQARLFECDGHQARELATESFPVTMDDLVTARDPEEQLQFSTQSAARGPSGASSGENAMFHGHGEGEGKIEADRDMYLSRVGKRLADALYNTAHPLIVLATEEVAGHFGGRNDVKIASVVHASPDGLSDSQLKSRLVEASACLLKGSEDALVESLGTAVANEAGSTDIAKIVSQAASGRVDTLLLAKSEDAGEPEAQCGVFDRDSSTARVDERGDCDLVSLAVRETLLAGGSVAALTCPSATTSAIYRF